MSDGALRALVRAAAAGAIGGTLIGTLALVVGFGVPVGLWTLAGLILAVAWWALTHLATPTEADRIDEPSAVPAPRSTQLDRRTRVLESQVRGAQPGRDMTASALHRTVSDIARARAGDGPYPPNLALYLNADPRPLSRAQLRAGLRELTAL